MDLPLPRILKVSAWLAVATVLGMIGIFLATGVGQDPLQVVHPAAEYAALLLARPSALRATIGLDDLFIALYTATFVSSALLLVRRGASRGLVGVALGFLLALALLDMVENFHFLVMLADAELGRSPSPAEIALQVHESLLKFHVGYVGVFLLGLALPRGTRRGRTLSDLCLFVQLPVGILVHVTPRAISIPLVFVRFGFFVAALLLIAGLFDAPAPGADFAAAGSGAPA